jgi:hypothetical protein
MLYPDVTSALATDRIRQYQAEAAAWRLARLARAACGARGGKPRGRPSHRAAPAPVAPQRAGPAAGCRG